MKNFLNCFSISKYFFFGLLVSGSLVALALAQQAPPPVSSPAAEGATLSPPLKELNLKPGEEAEETILVTNPTDNLLELYPSAMNFEASGEGGEPKFYSPYDETQRFSLAHWVVLPQPKIAIAPKQVIEFKYKIKVPVDAEPGGHYGVVFLATQPPEASGNASQVSIASMVGSLILVRIPGDIKEEASLEDFSTPWFFWKPPVPFQVFVRNKGNIHFKPRGEITIKNWRGKELERIDINEKSGNVLPESRRKFDPKWNAPASPFWKIPVGRFSADLRAVYGQSEKTLAGKIYFWIIPWWIILAAAITLVVFVIFVILIRRRRKKKRGGGSGLPPQAPGASSGLKPLVHGPQQHSSGVRRI